ncbi:hypothetical protein GGX14DRAFT_132341 [Mycena pura]|uniref:Uncharacterized protein n=1 Tax=Mycena pura TaxID=153505 RepID=A0AAD6VD06_9AGAR|nr:hypothetical protein GGX14DRAFT_132341 [Mycena pura]
MDAGRSWGFHDGACIFSADRVIKRDCDVPRDRNVAIGILKVPAHVSPAEFRQKLEALIDGIFDATKPTSRGTMYIQNLNADEHLQAAGYPPSQPTMILVVEYQTWDELIQLINNPEARSILEAGMKDFALHVDSICFSADVVVKFKRPEV